MTPTALTALVQATRALPQRGPVPPYSPGAPSMPPAPPAAVSPVGAQVGNALRRLAEDLEPRLQAAMTHAQRSWDQVDAVDLVLADTRAHATQVLATCRAAWAASTGAQAAHAALAYLTLESALTAVEVMQQRLAGLCRLRMQEGQGALTAGDRPFLDLAAALREAAEAWT